jgi:hypothetical protein
VPLLYFWKIPGTIASTQKAARLLGLLVDESEPGHRAVGKRTGDTIEWAWIGTHNEFDKLFG